MNLTETAMIANLSIRQWGGIKVDRKTTSKVLKDHQAAKDGGVFNKALIAKEALTKLKKVTGKARTYHYDHSLPWTDQGGRIITARSYQDYVAEMQTYRMDFDRQRDALLNEYPQLVKESQARLGKLFDREDYPSVHRLVHQFSFDIRFAPIASANDFRVTLDAAEVEKIRESLQESQKLAVHEAIKELWERVFKHVSHMADVLKHPDRRFSTTLVGNVSKICDVMEKLNLTDDPQLAELAGKLRSDLTGYEVNSLRFDPITRKQAAGKAARAADSIAKKMQAYTGWVS